jgi:hypothetical protein
VGGRGDEGGGGGDDGWIEEGQKVRGERGGEMRDCMVYFLAEDLGILFLLEAIVRRLLNR